MPYRISVGTVDRSKEIYKNFCIESISNALKLFFWLYEYNAMYNNAMLITVAYCDSSKYWLPNLTSTYTPLLKRFDVVLLDYTSYK